MRLPSRLHAACASMKSASHRRPQVGQVVCSVLPLKPLKGESLQRKGRCFIDIEAPLAQNLVYLRNRDIPGVIGQVGTILGNHKINIADFSLGRHAIEARAGVREAIAVVHVDEAVPETVLDELRKVSAIQQARAMRLY